MYGFVYFKKKLARLVLNRFYIIKLYVVNMIISMLSIFKLKHLKKSNHPQNIALTSTPTALKVAIHQTSDDSFLRLDDSEIDFEDSPSNRRNNRSIGKLSDSLIVNSTPLNHYSTHGSFRRNRSELSRTSLVYVWININFDFVIKYFSKWFNRFDDSDRQPGGGSLFNGTSPLKRKKLFDCSDDSDWNSQ